VRLHWHKGRERAARDLKKRINIVKMILCWTKDSEGGDFNFTVQTFAVGLVNESPMALELGKQERLDDL
jgi:hypothetical protein